MLTLGVNIDIMKRSDMRFTTEDGREWEFKGEVGTFSIGDVMVAHRIVPVPDGATVHGARVYPVPCEYKCGGVVFQETGETRAADGEWHFLLGSRVTVVYGSTGEPRVILRPVRIEPVP